MKLNELNPRLVSILEAILQELARAQQKFPEWPCDPQHAMSIVHEEIGELARAALQCAYDPDKSSLADVRIEAVQAAAMLIRFLDSLALYEFRPGVTLSSRPIMDVGLAAPARVACAACDRGDFQLGHHCECPVIAGRSLKREVSGS